MSVSQLNVGLPLAASESHYIWFEGLPEEILLEQVSADVPSAEISDFAVWPDVLHTEDSRARNVGILFCLDHDDKTGVYRN